MPPSANRPYSIKIFLPHGDPDGLRIIGKSNWTGTGVVFNRTPFLRKLFYKLLDLLLLRCWHIQSELRKWIALRGQRNKPITAIYDAGAGFGQYTYWLSGKLPSARITAIDRAGSDAVTTGERNATCTSKLWGPGLWRCA